MRYLETINLGCESDEIAEPSSSYLVRIDGYDDEGKVYGIAGYPTNITNLGNNTAEAIGYALQFLDEIDA